MTPNITICSQDQVDNTSSVATAFFAEVLDISYASVLMTDESELSDFSFSGWSNHQPIDAMTMGEIYDEWDACIMKKVEDIYGIKLSTTKINMVQLLAQVGQAARAKNRPH